MKKKIVLLINVGTPSAPSKTAVAKYLFEFLNDKYVMNLHWFFRSLLVNFIIIPFRFSKSTARYKKLWTKEGSPLLTNHLRLSEYLQKTLPDNYQVIAAMRYGQPSIPFVLNKIEMKDADEIIVVPLYPQYASSTTETAIHKFQKTIELLNIPIKWKYLEQFYSKKSYIKTLAKHIKTYHPENFDHLIFSYHGLPLSQIEVKTNEANNDNYIDICYKSSELLAKELCLNNEDFSTSFQSRMTKKWTKPFTEDKLFALLKAGKKKVLVVSPSFVADCLETSIDLGLDLKTEFMAHGGEKFVLVDSLNDNPEWISALAEMILRS